MGVMQPRRGNQKRGAETAARRVSLDLTERQDALDRRLVEAMERIERIRSKALLAVGTMLADER